MNFWRFFCRHRNRSLPRSRPGCKPYVICFDCMKTFEYDWDLMRLGTEIKIDANNQTARPGQRRSD
jgi:hypothetical protein